MGRGAELRKEVMEDLSLTSSLAYWILLEWEGWMCRSVPEREVASMTRGGW